MKKVLFMFVAVLALVSCQKGAEKDRQTQMLSLSLPLKQASPAQNPTAAPIVSVGRNRKDA